MPDTLARAGPFQTVIPNPNDLPMGPSLTVLVVPVQTVLAKPGPAGVFALAEERT